MKKIFCLFASILFSATISAQAIWDREQLEYVRHNIDKAFYASSYKALLKDADKMLEGENLSVMMKDEVPASGDKHDYMSLARYYWPDPDKPDGLPYKNNDGVVNPEINKLDRTRLGKMADRVKTLSLAWYFSGEERYAEKAVEQLQVWFLNKDTRMNPNLEYAQVVRGQNNNKGRSYGVLDAYSFVEMLDAVSLLEESRSFRPGDRKKLKAWFKEFLKWFVESPQGQEEAMQKNNHSIAYDAQAIALSIYTGDRRIAEEILDAFPSRRIDKQIEPDGSQPHELRRTLSFWYSLYNLQHITDISIMGKKLGYDIANYSSEDGRNYFKAMDFLTPYIGKPIEAWPYQQLNKWEFNQQEFCKLLYVCWRSLAPERESYHRIFSENFKWEEQGLFNLLHYRADNTMNLEMLFEASRLTGKKTYAEVAMSHADKTLQNHFRNDMSSYHVVEDYYYLEALIRRRSCGR